MTDLPYSHVVAVGDLPPHGLALELVPDAAACAALARHAGVLAVEGLRARLHFAPEGGAGVHLTGELVATVRQACGVTLEPFDTPVREAIDVHFVPQGTAPREVDEESEQDPPDEVVDGRIDAGALVGEFLALGVDPYPRKPGAVFEPPAEDVAAQSPFAALARLKGEE
ncbi:YceD family protein [Xanthobacter sp. AM11]|uniref:YceD family protein n=1 Tax=Xanthobacter sp. AM11 TaxID=3380643 RepID=UPI0039BFBD0B